MTRPSNTSSYANERPDRQCSFAVEIDREVSKKETHPETKNYYAKHHTVNERGWGCGLTQGYYRTAAWCEPEMCPLFNCSPPLKYVLASRKAGKTDD